MFTHSLRDAEIENAKLYIANLKSLSWTKNLISPKFENNLRNYKTLSEEHSKQLKSWIFELAIAYQLSLQNSLEIDYEYKLEAGQTSVDFLIKNSDTEFLVELLVNRDLQKLTAKNTSEIIETGCTFHNAIRNGNDEVEDIIKLQKHILRKVWDEEQSREIKFPHPKLRSFNIIIVNVESFNLGTMDEYDMLLTCGGNSCIDYYLDPAHSPFYKRYLQNGDGIRGIFDQHHPNQSMKYLREKIHAVGFFNPEEKKRIFYILNPLFPNDVEVIKSFLPVKELFSYQS